MKLHISQNGKKNGANNTLNKQGGTILSMISILALLLITSCNGSKQSPQLSKNAEGAKLADGVLVVNRVFHHQYSFTRISGKIPFTIFEEPPLPPKAFGTGEVRWILRFVNQAFQLTGEWKVNLTLRGEVRNHGEEGKECKIVFTVQEVKDEVVEFTSSGQGSQYADPDNGDWQEISGPIELGLYPGAVYFNLPNNPSGGPGKNIESWTLERINATGLLCFIPQSTATP